MVSSSNPVIYALLQPKQSQEITILEKKKIDKGSRGKKKKREEGVRRISSYQDQILGFQIQQRSFLLFDVRKRRICNAVAADLKSLCGKVEIETGFIETLDFFFFWNLCNWKKKDKISLSRGEKLKERERGGGAEGERERCQESRVYRLCNCWNLELRKVFRARVEWALGFSVGRAKGGPTRLQTAMGRV